MIKDIVTFSVVIPLILAAFFAALAEYLPRRLIDVISTATALSIAVGGWFLFDSTRKGPLDLWFGNWQPAHGVALGIAFHVDPMGSALLGFVGLLFFCAFLFSWRYFKEVKGLFHALMLAFLGAMAGFCLTGDLFNLFVWFELMTAAAVALCGYKSEEPGPLQGAIHLAVINTIGAFLALTGIGIIYSATGALNLVQIGTTLAKPEFLGNPIVITAFVFIALGFFVKAALVPFHFWLADAHAVAPTPVCMLFSGIMVELGIYAVFRVHWTAFAGALSPVEPKVRDLFLVAGSVTALVGAIQCLMQLHLKRLLAYSTISHLGLMTCGFALLEVKATAGTLLYMLAHGALKAGLFVCAGILLQRFGTVDELELQQFRLRERVEGRSAQAVLAILYFLCAFGLSGIPPYSTFPAEAWWDDAAIGAGAPWFAWIAVACCALTCAAVLRAGVRAILGWGERDGGGGNQGAIGKEEPETDERRGSKVSTMTAAALILLLVGLGVAWLPGIRRDLFLAAKHLHDSQTDLPKTLVGASVAWSSDAAVDLPPLGPAAVHGVIAFILAIAIATLQLLRAKGAAALRKIIRALLLPLTAPFHAIHSGAIGDALAWFAFGVAIYAGYLVLPHLH